MHISKGKRSKETMKFRWDRLIELLIGVLAICGILFGAYYLGHTYYSPSSTWNINGFWLIVIRSLIGLVIIGSSIAGIVLILAMGLGIIKLFGFLISWLWEN